MFKYYKNLISIIKLNYENDDQFWSSWFYHHEKALETVKDSVKGTMEDNKDKNKIQKDTSSTVSKDWTESNIFAWRHITDNISQVDYKVYKRNSLNEWFVDIKIDTGIFDCWDIIMEWVPVWLEQDVVNKVMKLSLSKLKWKKLIWNNTSWDLDSIRGDIESQKTLTIKDLEEQRNFFNNLLNDNDISNKELNSINYSKINMILRQSFSWWQEKSTEFIETRNDLLISINAVIAEYQRRLGLNDQNFKQDPKFEDFIVYKEKVINSLISNWKEFIKSIDKLSLSELLDTYKKLEKDESKRYMILQKIVDKHISWKWNHLAYWENWQIVIETSDTGLITVDGDILQPAPLNYVVQSTSPQIKHTKIANDLDSQNIISTISQEDLKWEMIRDVVSNSWFDVENESPNYDIIIPKILNNYGIKEDTWWPFVFHDIFTRKDELINKIQEKLSNSKDVKLKKDLNFVLDYISNQSSYPQKVIEKATQMSVLRNSWYDPTTTDWINRIENAFKEKHWVKTIINDLMSANWWLVWAAVVIWSIIGFFLWWNWRKASLIIMWISVFWPAAEQLAHKWGLVDYILKDTEEQKLWKEWKMIAWLENPFKDVDITIKNLPDKYDDKYIEMYKKNTSRVADKMIFPQDYWQIFSGLVQNKIIRDFSLNDFKNRFNKWESPKDILWKANIPKKYVKEILQSKWKDTIIEGDDRNLRDNDIKIFFELLLLQAEDWDKTLWDVFVKWQEKSTEYLDKNKFSSENTIISTEIDKIPFSSQVRAELVTILWRTKEIFSVDNAQATAEELIWIKTKRKEQINKIIIDLEVLKWKDTNIDWNIDKIIGEYNKVRELIDLWIKTDEYKAKSQKEWELFPWLSIIKDTANTWLGLLSTAVWYLKLDPSIVPQKLEELDLNKIDNLIKEWESLLTNNKEQDLEINKIITSLKEKKLWILRSKDRLNTTLQNWMMGLETQKVFASLLESNHVYYADMVNKIKLEIKPTSESIEGYSNLLVSNYEWIIFLKSIINIDDSRLGNKWKIIKTLAQIKIDLYDEKNTWFKKNLQDYIEKKKNELSSIDINNINLENIKSTEDQYIKIKEEFIKDGVISKNLNKLWVIFGIEALTTTGNSIADFEAYYNQILWTQINLDSGGFKNKLDEVELNVKSKEIELINSEPLPTLPTDISKQSDLDRFKSDLISYNTKIEQFKDTNADLVKAKWVEVNAAIWKIEWLFLAELTKLTDLPAISQLSTKWESFKKDLKYDGKAFKEAYEKKTDEIWEKIFYESLKNIKNIPEEIKSDLKGLNKDIPWLKGKIDTSNNVYELINTLKNVLDQYKSWLGNNPDLQPAIDNIDGTLKIIIEKLKWNYKTAEWYTITKFWEKSYKQILEYFNN